MKTPLRLLPVFLCLAGSWLTAAPSTELLGEWFVPLETRRGFALVDKASGQVRIMEYTSNGLLTQTGPEHTGLTEISGVSSGYDNTTLEQVILTSATNNRLALVPRTLSPIIFHQPSAAGPESAVVIRENPADSESIYIHSRYGNNGGAALEVVETPHANAQTLGLLDSNLPAFYAMQPLRNVDTNDSWAIATYGNSSTTRLVELFRASGEPTGNVKSFSVPVGSSLAPNVLGNDGRTCTVAFVPGRTAAEIFTHAFDGFTEAISTSNTLPFAIGHITPVNVPGANQGVLITAQDGSQAVFATVQTGNKFIIQNTFTPSSNLEINGLLPVTNRGLIVLERKPGQTTTFAWRFFLNNAGIWQELTGDKLSPWLPPSGNFATLFWFNGTPLIDPFAELIDLVHVPDWTLNPGPLPRPLSAESFVSTTVGLDNPALIAPAAPPGATYVMTNQYNANVSVSALADNLTLSVPSVTIAPESGTYASSVTITALYDESTAELRFREDKPGQPWQTFTDAITVGYPSTWLFHTVDIASGAIGPVISRTYGFSSNLNEIDTDGDGVPDYVEAENGLDPAGGADSDGDFQSDYEELLSGTDPTDPNSNTPEASRVPPYLGEGFYLYAQAFNATNGFASPYHNGGTPTTIPIVDESVAATQRADDTPGTKLNAARMTGTQLATGEVDLITQAPLSGQRGARLDITTPVPTREWLILSSPIYFNLGTGSNPPRTGRETFRVIQRPTFAEPTIPFTPSGTNQKADTSAWISAASTAQAAFQPITSVSRMEPADIAVAVMAEQALFNSLQTLSNQEKTDLRVPSAVSDFTLFPLRDGEAARTPFSQEMLDALLANGCDFQAILTLLEPARLNPAIISLSNAIYNQHVSISETETAPNVALPLDALRSTLRTGAIADPAGTVYTFNPDGSVASMTTRTNPYASITAALRTNARNAMLALLAGVPSTKRPTDTWTIEIQSPTTPGHAYDYRRTDNNNLTWLVDSLGQRFILEQGLGLNLGSLFTITGYTDAAPVSGFDTMEIISIDFIVTPATSDKDSNGNLLDDEWELFFFGQIGLHGPFDTHPTTGHSYLQYHIAGADPRTGDLIDPILDLAPLNPDIVFLPAFNAYEVSFDFPADYIDDFDFTIQSSNDLGHANAFAGPVNFTEVYALGPGRYAMRVDVPESVLTKNFFRVVMALPTP